MPLQLLSTAALSYTADGHQYMAANRMDTGTQVVVRRLPDNVIVSARLVPASLQLVEPFELISPDQYHYTDDGHPVIGYEDPTSLPDESPWGAGILATQVYHRLDGQEGVITNLVAYTGPDRDLIEVLSPARLRELGIPQATDMVKEAELAGPQTLFFEYTDGRSNIGLGTLDEHGAVIAARPFHTAAQDNSEHVSTAGPPVPLRDSTRLLLFNRRRANEWGVTSLIYDQHYRILEVAQDFLIRADPNLGRGPGDQLIAFASGVTHLADGTLEVLYHINDSSCHRAIVALT